MTKFLNFIRDFPPVYLLMVSLKYSIGTRYKILVSSLMSLLSNSCLLLQPFIFGLILNEIQLNGLNSQNITKILSLVGIHFSLIIVFWVIHSTLRYIESLNALTIKSNYLTWNFRGTLDLPLSWHSGQESGELINKISKASEALEGFSSYFSIWIVMITRVIGTVFAVYMFSPYLIIFMFMLLPVFMFSTVKFDNKMKPKFDELYNIENKISALVFDCLTNITSIKILAIESPIIINLKRSLAKLFPISSKLRIMIELKWAIGDIVFALIVSVSLISYIWVSYKSGGAIMIGSLSTLYIYLSNLYEVYYSFNTQYGDCLLQKTRIQNADNIKEEILKNKQVNRKKLDWKKVLIKDVKFKYQLQEASIHKHHLDFDEFSFKKGENIAIIGSSGSGKSTMLKVLHGMYSDVGCTIVVDGIETISILSQLDLSSTLVPQEPELFASTIRENITLGLDFSKDDIVNALDMAIFSEVVQSLPNGLESKINEKGVNLSGGQKQRLALARALLFAKGKNLLLLDESTSSVDFENEQAIYKAIFEEFENACIIASIHKLHLLPLFDRVVIFEDGKITADGTLSDLLKNNQSFAKSWEEYMSDTSNK